MIGVRHAALLAAALLWFEVGGTNFAGAATAADAPPLKVGAMTWHPEKFVGKEVTLSGYPLSREKDYVIFSDEPKGRVSSHDLRVSGPGMEALQFHKKYQIQGKFLDSGSVAKNTNRYHLELTAVPVLLGSSH
jgi:hypothetical protein